jgi:hypothetical protein
MEESRMTKFRAFNSALISVALLLSWGSALNAQTTNDITGTNSASGDACLVAIAGIFLGGLDCTSDATEPSPLGAVGWIGPIFSAGYYLPGTSPFDLGGPPTAPAPGDNKSPIAITGTVTIDDLGTPCDADDTIAASIALDAGTRAATGGAAGRLEESWGDGGIAFNIAATTVTSAAANGGGGCDYEIASMGMPPLMQIGGADAYPSDLDNPTVPMTASPIWDAPIAVPIGSWNPAGDGTGNVGASITVVTDGSWSCVENGTDGTQCDLGGGGSHFNGTRAVLENALIAISTDGGGDITSARMYANNEGMTLFTPPLTTNAWDGALLDFTGTCNNCGGGSAVAGDDAYSVLENSLATSLDTGANDTGWTGAPTVALNQVPDNGGTATVVPNADAALVTFDYTPALNFSGEEIFTYDISTATDPLATATVTVTVEADIPPVANPGTGPAISTQGVTPDSASGALDITTIAGNDLGNTPSTVSAVTAGASDAGTCSANGTTVTFTPDAATFVGTGVCDYTIEDAQTETATSTVTFDIPNALPAITDTSAGESPADEPVTVDLSGSITLGNGDAAQNPLTVTTDATDGSCTLTGTDLTYTPDAGFEGPDECTVTITDGNLDSADAVIDFLIAAAPSNEGTEGLPGGSSAVDLWTLSMLLGLPLLRRRRRS